MMRVLVTGVNGQLGYDVYQAALSRGYDVMGSDIQKESDVPKERYSPMDITKQDVVENVIEKLSPEVIIHCAAWTAVDAAEDPENRDIVYAVNAGGTRNLAEIAKKIGAKLIYISTDYVFDGKGNRPWKPDDKAFSPLNVYGQSKLDGEIAVSEIMKKYFIVRIAWVFGQHGNNFVRTMLRVGRDREFVTVVDDQIGTPTYTPDLAHLLLDMAETEKYGFYHVTNSEVDGKFISWADFAEWVYQVAGYRTEVRRVSTAEYGASVATRPFNSRLDKAKLAEAGFHSLPSWKDAVERYIKMLEDL